MSGKVSKSMAIGAGVIGIILICCGLGCAVAGFVWTIYGEGAHGIWSGLFMIVVGVLGTVILLTKSKPVMIVFLVFCIIDLIINIIQAIIAAIVVAIIAILKRALDAGNCKELNGNCYCSFSEDTSALSDSGFEFEGCDDINAMMACMRAVTAFSVIGIIATFAGSIIGCVGACCDKGGDTPGIVVIQQGQQPQVQTTTVQTFHQTPAPGPPQQYPGDPEMGAGNPGF